MNTPAIRKDDLPTTPSMGAGNSAPVRKRQQATPRQDELLRQLAERARTQRLRHQRKRVDSEEADQLEPPVPGAGTGLRTLALKTRTDS